MKWWGWALIVGACVLAYLWYEGDLGGLDLTSFLPGTDEGATDDSTASGGGSTSGLTTAWATAVQAMEGYFAPGENPSTPNGSLSYNNNNPGNLETAAGTMQVFDNYEDGFAALETYLGNLLNNNPNWTLQQATNYYVNGNDSSTAQNTVNYAVGVSSILSKALGFAVTPATTLADLNSASAASS
jgi:hypothetical protein